MADHTPLVEHLNRTPGARCPACAYSLDGVTTDRCPECGRQLRLELAAGDGGLVVPAALVLWWAIAAGIVDVVATLWTSVSIARAAGVASPSFFADWLGEPTVWGGLALNLVFVALAGFVLFVRNRWKTQHRTKAILIVCAILLFGKVVATSIWAFLP